MAGLTVGSETSATSLYTYIHISQVLLYLLGSNIAEDIGVIENCTFEGNTASDSGAAVSLSSELLFDTDQSPTVQFKDWYVHE